jgi:hypothetical protein
MVGPATWINVCVAEIIVDSDVAGPRARKDEQNGVALFSFRMDTTRLTSWHRLTARGLSSSSGSSGTAETV